MKYGALFFFTACAPNLALPDAAKLACTKNADCPNKLVCQTTEQRCVALAALDTTPPELTLAVSVDEQAVELTFNEAISAALATSASNYTITPTLSIDSASLAADQQTVVLAVRGQQDNQAYVVTVQNITDLAGNAIAAANHASFVGLSAAPDPSAPEAIAPEPGARQFSVSEVTLAWTGRNGASSYSVEVAYDADFSTPVAASPYLVTAASADTQQPTTVSVATPAATTYYWRVRADLTTPGEYGASFFNVIGDTLYVYCPAATAPCDDSNSAGNLSSPFQTINRALADAKVNGASEVRVADRGGGAAYPELVTLPGGSALRGGYGPDFSDTSQAGGTFVTRIANAGGYTIYADSVTATTLVDDFTIDGGTANVVHAIELANCTSALTFSNDIVSGGSATSESAALEVTASIDRAGPIFTNDTLTGSSAANSYAVKALGGSVSVQHSTLRSGSDGTLSSYGFFADYTDSDGGAIVTDDDIAANSSTFALGLQISAGTNLVTHDKVRGDTQGVFLDGPNTLATNNDICAGGSGGLVRGALFVNNTLCGGSGSAAAVDVLQDFGSGSVVANNILFSRASASGSTCYYASAPGARFENNLLFDCTHLASALIGAGNLDTIGAVNTASNYGTPAPIVDGNLTDASAESDFADFAGGDLHLLATTPAAIRLGGLDASSATYGSVTDDFDHAPRTCPTPGSNCYSIGAYEED